MDPGLSVQVAIRDKIQCDKKSFLAVVDASKKRNLMTVGGHVDNIVDLCGDETQYTMFVDDVVSNQLCVSI
jgi:hypothetical protein